MANRCYLCNRPATKKLELSNTFTMHSSCKNPQSDKMCDRCWSSMAGDEKFLWYWNESKGKWSKVAGRSLSRIYQGDKLIAPVIEGERTEGKDTFKIVKNLLTRVEMRNWILNPPEPPFTIAIAESGQKHILPWAKEGFSRDTFPVQFELDCVYIDDVWRNALGDYESLLSLHFSKTEVDRGEYRSDRLFPIISTQSDRFDELELSISKIRGTRSLELISHIAQSHTL